MLNSRFEAELRKLLVLKTFHVFVAPESEGAKETRKDFEAGALIECTPEQEQAGRAAGLLGDPPQDSDRHFDPS